MQPNSSWCSKHSWTNDAGHDRTACMMQDCPPQQGMIHMMLVTGVLFIARHLLSVSKPISMQHHLLTSGARVHVRANAIEALANMEVMPSDDTEAWRFSMCQMTQVLYAIVCTGPALKCIPGYAVRRSRISAISSCKTSYSLDWLITTSSSKLICGHATTQYSQPAPINVQTQPCVYVLNSLCCHADAAELHVQATQTVTAAKAIARAQEESLPAPEEDS